MADSAERVARHRAKKRYVEEIVEAARRDAESRAASRAAALDQAKDLPEIDVEMRVERARAYAEWRWAGFHAGEVASL